MADKSVQVKVDGLAQAQRRIRRAKNVEIDAAMAQIYQEVSSLVADAAKERTPVRSGRLKADTKAAATKRAAQVRVGKRGKNATGQYAGVNVYGWPGRFRGSESVQKAVKDRWRKVRRSMESGIDKVMRRI